MRQGIISNDGCTPNCIKLRINAKEKNASIAQDAAIATAYGKSSLFLSTLKCWTVRYPITNWGSETDYVTKLRSMIIVSTEESPDVSYNILGIRDCYSARSRKTCLRQISKHSFIVRQSSQTQINESK